MRFPSHTPDTAVGKAADLLGDVIERHGSAGTMVRTMAGSASILAGYLELSRAVKRSTLGRQLSERISLAVQDQLGCGLCLQAHTSAAQALGISEDEITRAREGGSADARIKSSTSAVGSTPTPRPSPTTTSSASAPLASPIAKSSTSWGWWR